MENIFITSDTHFYHKNILKYQPNERPFDSVEEMNEAIIERWNEVVGDNDIIYHLGDFAFANKNKVLELLKRLRGRKFLVFGNHDGVMKSAEVREHFEWMGDYKEIKVDGKYCVLMHYPIFSWNRMQWGSYHFYGHTHCQIPHLYHGASMDVGVDGNNLYPWNIREIFENFEAIRENSEENIDPREREYAR